MNAFTTKSNSNIVRAARRRLGLSLSETAEALSRVRLRDLPGALGSVRSLTRQNIWQYEHGVRNPDKLFRLALALVVRWARKGKKP